MKPTLFKFQEHSVRVVQIKGQPWFVAKDAAACLALSFAKGSNRLLSRLTPDEKNTLSLSEGIRGNPNVTIISESGLYKLIMRSDKPEARKFQDWVTQEVLPAIRKDGAYISGEEKVKTGELSEDEFLLRAFDILKKKTERLSLELAEARKEIDFVTVAEYAASLRVGWTRRDRAWFGRRASKWARERCIEIKRLPCQFIDKLGDRLTGEVVEYPRALLDEVRLSFAGQL